MKLTNIEMNNVLSNLGNISDKVTGKLAYAVARNMRKIGNEIVDFENIRNKLINKYGTLDENENNYVIKVGTEEHKKFMEEISEYTSIEHDVDIYKVDKEEIFKSNLTAKEIINLDFMIEETDE